MEYGESVNLHGVKVSLHPAGHILGSSMVRVEYQGIVWLISGDYKTQPDPTCRGIEPVRCNVFISESTFGLPIYRWQSSESIMEEVHRWWKKNREQEQCSVIFAYALGKSQRILAGLQADIASRTAERDTARARVADLEGRPAGTTAVVACSALQGRLALKQAGHLEAIEAMMAGLPATDERRIYWEYATVWHRDHAVIAVLGASAGLDASAIDALLAAAMQIG